MNKKLYQKLQLRSKENQKLSQGGWGRWPATRWMAEDLAVHPWRVIGPVAVGVSLVGWWLNRASLTRIMLRIFGGE